MEFLNAVWEKLWTSASKWLFHNGKLNEEMEVLLKKTEAMRSLQEDVKIALESLEHRHKKKRKREVDIWLREVQRKKVEIEKREQEVKESMHILQWRLRRLVRRDIREVSQLFEQGKFHEGLSIFQESQGEVQDYSEEIQGIVQAGPSMSSTVLNHHWTSEDLSEEDSLEYFLEEKDLSKRDKHHKGLLTGKDQSPEEVQKNSDEVAHGVFEGPAIPFVDEYSSGVLHAAEGGAQLEPEEVERIRKKDEDTRRFVFKTKSEVEILDDGSSSQRQRRRKEEGEKRRELVPAPQTGNTEIPPDDGFTWRKYGQKEILGSKYPRGYYRCANQKLYNCPAKKQVQRMDGNPVIYEVTYIGEHSCHKSATALSVAPPDMIPQPMTQAVTLGAAATSQDQWLDFRFGGGDNSAAPSACSMNRSADQFQVPDMADVMFNSGSSRRNSLDFLFSSNMDDKRESADEK